MDIDGSGANKLARFIVSHARRLEAEEAALEMVRERLRALKANTTRIELENIRIQRLVPSLLESAYAVLAFAVAAVLLASAGLCTILFPYWLRALVFVCDDVIRIYVRRNVTNPLRIVYNDVGCTVLQLFPTWTNPWSEGWFYLFNGTVNQSLCFK